MAKATKSVAPKPRAQKPQQKNRYDDPTAALAQARAAHHLLAALQNSRDLIGDALQSCRIPVSNQERAQDLDALEDIADEALARALARFAPTTRGDRLRAALAEAREAVA